MTRRLTTLGIAMLLLAAGCSSDSGSTPPGTTAPPGSGTSAPEATEPARQWDIAVDDQQALTKWPLYVADAQGFLADEGIDLEFVDVRNNATVLAALSGDDIDIASSTLVGLTTFNDQGGEGQYFVSLYDIDYNLTAATGSTSGASWEDRVRALEGKTIGVPGGPESFFARVTRRVLEDVGLDPDRDVDIIAVTAGVASVSALQAGQIDAYASDSLAAIAGAEQGVGEVILTTARGEGPDLLQGMFLSGLLAKAGNIAADPDLFVALRRAVDRASEVLQSDAPADRAIAAEALVDYLAIDLDVAEAIVASGVGKVFTSDISEQKISQSLDRVIDLGALDEAIRPDAASLLASLG